MGNEIETLLLELNKADDVDNSSRERNGSHGGITSVAP